MRGPREQDETIDKLRLANEALRKQLKEFSRALDASLASNADDAESASGSLSARDREAFLLERRRMMNALAGKVRRLRRCCRCCCCAANTQRPPYAARRNNCAACRRS